MSKEDRKPWFDPRTGITGTGPTYGEHSYNGRPFPEGKIEPGLLDESEEDELKERVISLITKDYEYAKVLSDVNFHTESTEQHAIIKGEIDMAKKLGLITDEEVREIQDKVYNPHK